MIGWIVAGALAAALAAAVAYGSRANRRNLAGMRRRARLADVARREQERV